MSLALSIDAPLSGSAPWGNDITIPGREADERPFTADGKNVSFGYFRTLGIRLLEGRTWESEVRTGGLPEAVISEAMAKAGWPGESAVGKFF